MDFNERRILGRTGLSVSRLGLASGYGIPAKAVERAYAERGINYFFWSTPRNSGMAEGLRALTARGREKMVIALQSYDHSGLLTTRSVDKGLAALGIDYADVLILGWHNSVPWGRLLDTARDLKRRGRIRFIGMSGHNRKTFGKLAADHENPIDVFMVRYNAAHPGAEHDVFPHLAAADRPGITIYTATSWRKLLKRKKMPAGEEPLSAADCYRFVLSDPHVDLCLMGPSSEEEMEGGLKALDLGPLSDQEMARIRRIGAHVHG
ncbi:MAG: aldo/keto reductase [Spirochaetes bacterium]|nr:aldo/keto reductase [Spirochaetota bacterium]